MEEKEFMVDMIRLGEISNLNQIMCGLYTLRLNMFACSYRKERTQMQEFVAIVICDVSQTAHLQGASLLKRYRILEQQYGLP